MRVCSSCGLGLLLEARIDLAPAPSDAFIVVDSMLAVEAMSERAERLLEITEQCAIHRPIRDLLAPAGVEGASDAGLIGAIIAGATGSGELASLCVRPRNTFGVRSGSGSAPAVRRAPRSSCSTPPAPSCAASRPPPRGPLERRRRRAPRA